MSRKRRKAGIIAIDNPDKTWHEDWEPIYEGGHVLQRHPMNIPHPFRAVLLGPPGVGKTTIAMNLVMYQKPEFARIYVIHVDGEYTQEYDALENFELLESIPDPTWWPGTEKALVIIDDKELKGLPKEQKVALDRLFGYVSTHKNISVILTAQDPFNTPAIVRRCANLWVLWKTKDADSVATIGRKAGLKVDDLRRYFKSFGDYDSLWIDTTPKSPYPLRINGVDIVRDEDEQEEE